VLRYEIPKRKKSSASLIGLTGSCGKTTVKSMLGSILTPLAPTVVTAGNYNNHVGLPLTLWRLAPDTRYGVLEMGANHPGEIAYLSKLAEVDVALITNVAPAHLAGFGTLENVARAKGEIYDNLKPEGIAVLNADEPYLSLWQAKLSKQARVFFGLEVKKDIWADNIECYPLSSQFVLQTPVARQQVTLQVAGKHNISNALAAASAAYALGISLEDIVAGLEAFEGVLGRLCVYQGLNGVRLIDDTYNANPRSVEAALGVLANMPGDKIFVFGQMRELGQDEVSWHQKIGEIAKSKGIDKLYALGGLCQHTAEAFGEAARWFETHEDLILALKTECHPKVSLLIKGSRSSRMEKVVNALK